VDITTISMILAAALAVSEALSMIPAVKSNGVFQMFYNTTRTIARLVMGKGKTK